MKKNYPKEGESPMKRNYHEDTQDMTSLPIDFGAAFGDGDAVCDYTNCICDITNFLAIVVALIERQITENELRSCESSLHRQYLQRHPFAHGADEDTAIYETPWRQQNGTPICLRVTLLKRNSIKVPMANKKMSRFEICEPSGEPLGTMRSLPWHIDNYADVAYAVRAVIRNRFSHELLGSRLANSWIKAGEGDTLPCTIYVGETADGDEFSLRFSPADSEANADERIHAVATLLVDGVEIPLQELLPPMFRAVNPSCLDVESYMDFNDIVGRVDCPVRQDWVSMIRHRYDFLAVFQRKRSKHSGILPVVLQGGIPAEVFHTGTWTDEGKAVYGLCRNRGEDGRWTQIYWVLAEHLDGVGVTKLPEPPDWKLEWHRFDSQLPMADLSPHILDHASRWADPTSLTGEKDADGNDIFVSALARDEMFAHATAELDISLSYVSVHPEAIAYGYYYPVVDRTLGECSPISILLPGFFMDLPDGTKRPQAVFVLRIRNASKSPFFEVPTVLPIPWARRSALILGQNTPAWMSVSTSEFEVSLEARKAS